MKRSPVITELVNGVNHYINMVTESPTLSLYTSNDSSLFNHYVFLPLLVSYGKPRRSNRLVWCQWIQR